MSGVLNRRRDGLSNAFDRSIDGHDSALGNGADALHRSEEGLSFVLDSCMERLSDTFDRRTHVVSGALDKGENREYSLVGEEEHLVLDSSFGLQLFYFVCLMNSEFKSLYNVQ